jgi:hypothetical protein
MYVEARKTRMAAPLSFSRWLAAAWLSSLQQVKYVVEQAIRPVGDGKRPSGRRLCRINLAGIKDKGSREPALGEGL